MNLKSMMAADVDSVFLNDNDHAEDVVFYPLANAANKETISMVVVRDHEEGTREAHGDGVVNDNNINGKSLRMSTVLEMSATVAISDPDELDGLGKVDLFVFDGETWAAKRILGRDDYMLSLLVVRKDRVTTRGETRTG